MNTRIRKKLIRQGHADALRSNNHGNGGQSGAKFADKDFFTWFWEDVIGLASASYRRAFWHEAYRGHTIGPVPETLASWQYRRGIGPGGRLSDLLLVLLFVGSPALVFYVIRRLIFRYIAHLRRPTYYERERERRIELGRQRRAITARTTHNQRPSVEAIRAAWNGARHSPEGALRLGGMLEDLECYESRARDGGAIVSRTGLLHRKNGV